MNNIFILRPDVTLADIQDAIDERITKLKGIVGCLLVVNEDLRYEIIHDVAWVADGIIEELQILKEYLCKKL